MAVGIGLLLGIDAQDDLGAGGAPAALAYQAFPSQISHIQRFGGQLLQVGRRQRLAFGCTALTDLKLLAQQGQARGIRRLEHKVTHNFEGYLAGLPVGSGFELDGVAGDEEIPGSEPLQKLSAAAWLQDCGLHGEMVVKPAAQMVEMVADALAVRAAGGEQQAGGFDRSGGAITTIVARRQKTAPWSSRT